MKIMARALFQLFCTLLLLASCGQRNQSAPESKHNDDSVFVLFRQIDSIEKRYNYSTADYQNLNNLADRIKPYCDKFRGKDKSKLPEIYNFCASMLSRRCYLENGQPYPLKNCRFTNELIDCCLKAIPISRQMGDTLTLNYTNSLHFLADAYEQTGSIDEAMKLRFESLEKYREMFTEMSDMTAFAYYEIGRTYEITGNIKKADEYFKKVLRLQKVLDSKYLIDVIDSIRVFQKKYK
jgi:tetratricopeptide (TPR) repeat protein